MFISNEQEASLQTAFRPHAPIVDPNSFIGRKEQLGRVRDAIGSPGLHVVVYGERGCGKTSLANVATAGHERLQVFCEANATFTTLLRDIALKYQHANSTTVIFDAHQDTIISNGSTLPVSKLTGNMFLQLVAKGNPLCIVLDELDRIEDKSVISLLAELTKNAATYAPELTFIMVGASETAEGLLAGHGSNFRNLRQVALTRMSNEELRGIIDRGQNVLQITFEPSVITSVIEVSDQMPYYLHLLATSAARAALSRQSNKVQINDLLDGSIVAAQNVDHSLRETYEIAIMSSKGSKIYRRVIWAMASIEGTTCNVGLIVERANALARQDGDSEVSPPAIGTALKRLRSPDKREIVSQVADGVQGAVKFTHPLMKGFVRLSRYSK